MAAYDRALVMDPNAGEAHMRRALMFASAKRQEEALAALEKALAIDSGKAQTHDIAASIYTVLGDKAAAEAQVNLALVANPKHIPSLMRRAALLLERRALDDAMSCYHRVLVENANHAEALFRKAMIHVERVEMPEACNLLAHSISVNPLSSAARLNYAEVLRSVRLTTVSRYHTFAILQCLNDPNILNYYLSLPWLHTIQNDSSMVRFLEIYQAKTFEQATSLLDISRDDAVYSLPFLTKGLTELIIPNYSYERSVGHLRRYALNHIGGEPSAWGWNKLLIALARHHFLVEYVGEETPEETAKVEALGAALAAGSPVSDILTYAAYRPLAQHAQVKVLAERLKKENDPEMAELVMILIDEPLEEKQIKQSIEMIGSFANQTSQDVNAMYEENPYPRWNTLTKMQGVGEFGDLLKATFPSLKNETIPTPKPLRVLIPGCGTGQQSANVAMTFNDSEVLAIDLSKASLSYAIRSTKKLGINTITYKQADLLELPKHVDEKFDFIETTGVLHHLKDPKEGFKAVLSMLKPEGYLSVALYSEIARSMVIASRQFIAENNFQATPEGIRACRKALFALPKDHPTHIITQGRDFFTMSTCRDLIFHVQEHRFTLLQLRDLLDELGLEFLGFFGMQSLLVKAYKEMFPEDTTLTNLEKWHEFEVQTPIAFASMYHFWLRRRRH